MPILEFRDAPCHSANLYLRSLICFKNYIKLSLVYYNSLTVSTQAN